MDHIGKLMFSIYLLKRHHHKYLYIDRHLILALVNFFCELKTLFCFFCEPKNVNLTEKYWFMDTVEMRVNTPNVFIYYKSSMHIMLSILSMELAGLFMAN